MFTRMHTDVRKWTRLLQESIDEGTMDPKAVADMCLAYMSEADVEDMCRANDLKDYLDPNSDEDEEDEDEEDEDETVTIAEFWRR